MGSAPFCDRRGGQSDRRAKKHHHHHHHHDGSRRCTYTHNMMHHHYHHEHTSLMVLFRIHVRSHCSAILLTTNCLHAKRLIEGRLACIAVQAAVLEARMSCTHAQHRTSAIGSRAVQCGKAFIVTELSCYEHVEFCV